MALATSEASGGRGPQALAHRVSASSFRSWSACAALAAVVGVAGRASAQEPAPAEPATAPAEPDVAAEPADDAPAVMQEAPAVAAVEPEPTAPEPSEPAAAAEEPTLEMDGAPEAPPEAEEAAPPPSVKLGVGIRTGLSLTLNDPNNDVTLALSDGLVDQVNIRPYLSGQLTESIGFTANFETGTGSGLGINVMDAILQVKFDDAFQLWIGQFIPANDRNNMNGPFFASGWNFPITVQSYPFDVAARDRGFTFWGMLADGLFKYHLSVADVQPPASQPVGGGGAMIEGAGIGNVRLGSRLTFSFWEPENFYYASGTYYGGMDVFAIGLVGQYQKGPDAVGGGDLDNDFKAFSADLLLEKNLDSAGTFTVEGGYWNFEETGAGYVVNQGTIDQGAGVAGPLPGSSYMVALGWLTPDKMGLGQLRPNARLQIGDYGTDTSMTLDAGIAYIVDGFNHRWHLNFRHQDPGGDADAVDSIQLGAQFQM